MVHDELVTCAQKDDSLGLIAHLSGEQAISDTEGAGGGEYDDTLAAPKATTGLVKTGAVQYVGLRADTRHRTRDVRRRRADLPLGRTRRRRAHRHSPRRREGRPSRRDCS